MACSPTALGPMSPGIAQSRKYPRSAGADTDDLVASTPGEEGKWFAAAKQAGCSMRQSRWRSARRAHRRLTAPRDFAEKNPPFALRGRHGEKRVHWLVAGYGYDVTAADVLDAYTHTFAAAERLGRAETTRQRIRDLVAKRPVVSASSPGRLGAIWSRLMPRIRDDRPETGDALTDAALDALDADELRALIRELLPWFDDRLHARFVNAVIDHAARNPSGWVPAAPVRRSLPRSSGSPTRRNVSVMRTRPRSTPGCASDRTLPGARLRRRLPDLPCLVDPARRRRPTSVSMRWSMRSSASSRSATAPRSTRSRVSDDRGRAAPRAAVLAAFDAVGGSGTLQQRCANWSRPPSSHFGADDFAAMARGRRGAGRAAWAERLGEPRGPLAARGGAAHRRA